MVRILLLYDHALLMLWPASERVGSHRSYAPHMPKVYEGLDYPADTRPQPSLGLLALQIRELYGVDGKTALTAAVLLDQGKATDSLTLLDAVQDERARMAEAEAAKRKARAAGNGGHS